MSIPQETSVLVVGGGPAGSYAASVLAREGISTVLLEADVFPRYHIGESMLPSMRHFLRFIDLDETFVNHGFVQKKGAAFKLNSFPEAYTDFVAAGGPDAYAWNVDRAEADNLMFQHARQCGAKAFDGVKVSSIEFKPLGELDGESDSQLPNPGRPVSAQWLRKDGTSGTINFEYLIDASGRAGLVSTKYYKNRKYNQGLKNIANWGYWENAKVHAPGTQREGQPFFEALQDASGWVWTIPLHNNRTSVGVVMNQATAATKKKAMEDASTGRFYLDTLKSTPETWDLVSDANLVSEVKSASDWSYSASTYATPYIRIAGDAGCFIDPYFSSGVHLALASGLSAATTICAAKRGQLKEVDAAKWHSSKVGTGYTRFLVVVMSALKQITVPEEPVIGDWDEQSFDQAFSMFKPIIQGTADVTNNLTAAEISQTIDFCMKAFYPAPREQREVIFDKLSNGSSAGGNPKKSALLEQTLSADEQRILTTMRARNAIRTEDLIHIDNFSVDIIDGMVPHLKHGDLGLIDVAHTQIKPPTADTKQAVSIFSY
ncbi:FAD/NAD(P)-binding domain-containing protein [Xylona heveae TC161]|uniref:FAD/NAD(P)-binding domain-containing protein n=1 Tax=Xylona heveae (strain CBS 132557 / TC161) TaxID=1328760 RepID=A0A165IT25_XYLHT|nr:FAD/NAD(P)-binding domain-containing protein [Xylona heveae TC161]KZF25346.1 FAD/NAD(P)-binding domain-containing protein [Xylona heveae TC161]